MAVIYFATGKLSLELLNEYKIVTVGIFAAEGFALAFALYYGKKVLGGIFLGQLVLALSNGVALVPALEVSFINATEALLAIYLIKRFHIDTKLSSLRDIVLLGSFILFILQPFSAILSNLALSLHGIVPLHKLQISIFSWWFGNTMAQLLITPFCLLFLHREKNIDFKNFLFVAVAMLGYVYLLVFVINIHNPFLLMIFILPVLLVITYIKGLLYGTFLVNILALLTSFSIYKGIGAFTYYSYFDNTINFNLFILTQLIVILLTGFLFEERRRNEEKLHEIIKEEVAKNEQHQMLLFQQNRLAQMGEMIAMIAHQWRQPLNNISVINQYITIQLKKGKDIEPKKMQELLGKGQEQVMYMSKTIDDFRDFFKSDQESEQFEINQLIAETIKIVEPFYAKSSIYIQFTPQNPIHMHGIPNALSQAMLNILNNAKDALKSNETVTEKTITITLQEDEETIKISIEDNAGGIADTILDKIFDPYFSTKKEKNGTGLGLYMSKMIIEKQLHGTLHVANTQKGALFSISLQKENHELS
jgi:signal transduction histidine kinase